MLRDRGFNLILIHTDLQSSFKPIRTHFPGVVLDIGGERDFVTKVDVKIRRIKEMCRSVEVGLQWKLPILHGKDLVAYAVS